MNVSCVEATNQNCTFWTMSEASANLEKGLKKYELEYQLVPPHVQRRYAAEQAIQTFKSHFLAFLATCDPDFPVAKWDHLPFQVKLTLNLLRSKLSARA